MYSLLWNGLTLSLLWACCICRWQSFSRLLRCGVIWHPAGVSVCHASPFWFAWTLWGHSWEELELAVQIAWQGVKFGGTGISNANSLGGKGLKEFGGTNTSSLLEELELAELEPSAQIPKEANGSWIWRNENQQWKLPGRERVKEMWRNKNQQYKLPGRERVKGI